MLKRLLATLTLAIILLASSATAWAATPTQIADAAQDTAAYLRQTVVHPQVSSIGGEWTVLALARGGYLADQSYGITYYQTLEMTLQANQGVLDERKTSEYARVVLALSALGKDARDVSGYDLVQPLLDYDRVVWQGVNGPIFALLALDSGNYGDSAVRNSYLEYLLAQQLADGGWAIAGNTADPDTTAMALQALAKYQQQAAVRAAIDRALSCLSGLQNSDAGFTGWQAANSESVSQVIIALGELGIDIDDSRFVKGGRTMADNLLSFYQQGSGFYHSANDEKSNLMASEQALCALVALLRAEAGSNSFYQMNDAARQEAPSRHPDVQAMPIIAEGKTFSDISGSQPHANRQAIEALAARGIINGMTENYFQPDATMTRAQFAAIITRGLGLQERAVQSFRDIAPTDWYAGYIEASYYYGITNGTSSGLFTPQGAITREQAVTMLSRAAALCGLRVQLSEQETAAALNAYSDSSQLSDWARTAMAYCLNEGIWQLSSNTIQLQTPILRCEMAQAIFNLLLKAGLLE